MVLLAPTVLMPYVVVVTLSGLGIMAMCIHFCLDQKNANDQNDSWEKEANDTVDGGTNKGKDKTQEVDIEMDTFKVISADTHEDGASRETILGVEEPDRKKTPLVLRALSPRESLKRGGGQGRTSLKEKVLSGSRGGQSSWAYVNLAFEKDVDLILSPETLKRRKEERMARDEKLNNETRWRKDERGGKKARELGRTESVWKTVNPGARGEDDGKTNLKTSGRGWDKRGGERRSDRSGNKSSSLKTKKNSGTSKSWPLSKEESAAEGQTAAWERNQIVRGYENLAVEVTDGTGGFRLKQLTREWDTETWRKGRKEGEGLGGGGSGSSRGSKADEGKDAVSEKHSARDEEKTSSSRPPPRKPSMPLSQFSTSTKLLLSPEDEEASEDEERQGRDRGYSTLPREGSRDGLREGDISFFADGRKRDFKYFSAP